MVIPGDGKSFTEELQSTERGGCHVGESVRAECLGDEEGIRGPLRWERASAAIAIGLLASPEKGEQLGLRAADMSPIPDLRSQGVEYRQSLLDPAREDVGKCLAQATPRILEGVVASIALQGNRCPCVAKAVRGPADVAAEVGGA